MMDFTPKNDTENPFDVPFFDDVDSGDGWVGHTTGKGINTLKSEITQGMTRLGATVSHFQEGTFGASSQKPREGFLMTYSIDGIAGQIKIAALPVKKPTSRTKGSYETKKNKSLRMALYMFRDYVNGMWYAQRLSPGYLPLIPWMLEEGSGKTFSELFSERNQFALPAPSGDEAEFIDVEFNEEE